jgi:hypothetical protein
MVKLGTLSVRLLSTLLYSSLAFSQTTDIAGQAQDCNWLPALRATLDYNGEDIFSGWTDHDRLSAIALIKSCKPMWGDRGRSDEMVRLLEARWNEKQRSLEEQQRKDAQMLQLERDRIAQEQRTADKFSRAHSAQSKTGRAVRIFFVSQRSQYHTGDTIPGALLNTILFTQEPCPLELGNKEQLLRAWMSYASHQLGCWAPTIDDGFIFIGSLPELTHASQIPWEAYPRGLLHEDGSVTITEPNYDSATFLGRVTSEHQMKQVRERRNELP